MPKHQVEDLWYDEDTDQIYRRNKNGFIDLTVDLSSVSTAISSHASIVAGSTLGHVKSGTDITVDGSGNVSVNDNSHSHVSANISDAASAATASVVIVRDSAGRAQVADPSAAADIATKNYVDSLSSIYAPAQTNHGTNVGTTITAPAGVVGKLCILRGYGRTSSSVTRTVNLSGSYAIISAQVATAGDAGTTVTWSAIGNSLTTITGSSVYNTTTGCGLSFTFLTGGGGAGYFKYQIVAYRIS